MSRNKFLTEEDIDKLFERYSPQQQLSVTRIRYKNATEIRMVELMTTEQLKSLILTSMEEGHQVGGDLELQIPKMEKILIGHHDGLYWLQEQQA